MWSLKVLWNPNVLSQTEHENRSLVPCSILMCIWRVGLSLKALVQTAHLNFLPSACTLFMWNLKIQRSWYVLSQTEQQNLFSVFWWTVFTWRFRLLSSPNVASHIEHLYCFIFSWTVWMCFWTRLFMVNSLRQIGQEPPFTLSWTVLTCVLRHCLSENTLSQTEQAGLDILKDARFPRCTCCCCGRFSNLTQHPHGKINSTMKTFWKIRLLIAFKWFSVVS